jgi:hypothetical protein
MPPKIAGIIKLINHKIIVAAKISKLFEVYLLKIKSATLPLNPKSINAIFNGLIVCKKNILIVEINSTENLISISKKYISNIN